MVAVFGTAALLEGGSRFIARRYLTHARPESGRVLMDDMLLHHIWVPRRVTIDGSRGVPYPLAINSQSWVETYDVKREKDAGVTRVFYLGDSNTQGVVAPEHKMVELVEKGLNAAYAGSSHRFEVINTGTSSYSFLQYFLLAKMTLPDYAPDLVVINVDMSDVANHAVYRRHVVVGDDGEPAAIPPKASARYILTPEGHATVCSRFVLPHMLTDHSDFFYLVDLAVRSVRISAASRNIDKSANWLDAAWSESVDDEVRNAMAVLRATLRLLKSRGTKVAVTGVPFYGQYSGELSDRPHTVLARAAAEEAVPFLNSFEALEELVAGTLVARYYWETDPTHFNVEGNRIWADVQLAFLLDPVHGLLPPRPVTE